MTFNPVALGIALLAPVAILSASGISHRRGQALVSLLTWVSCASTVVVLLLISAVEGDFTVVDVAYLLIVALPASWVGYRRKSRSPIERLRDVVQLSSLNQILSFSDGSPACVAAVHPGSSPKNGRGHLICMTKEVVFLPGELSADAGVEMLSLPWRELKRVTVSTSMLLRVLSLGASSTLVFQSENDRTLAFRARRATSVAALVDKCIRVTPAPYAGEHE